MTDFLAGALSGIAQTIFGHPFDTIKVNIQNNESLRNFKPRDYFRGILFPMGSAFLINSIGFGVHSIMYEQLNNHITAGGMAGIVASPLVHISCIGKVKEQVGLKPRLKDFLRINGYMSTLIREVMGFSAYFYVYNTLRERDYSIVTCGALSGLANWTISYPIDVIRSRQYAYNINFKTALKQRGLYKGYIACAIRAMIVNSTGFWVYEKTFSLFK